MPQTTILACFTDFTSAAASGALRAYPFLEPSWSARGNSQHPNYNVALGERLIHNVYYALRNGPNWNQTLLIVTYDEHGGCYDHVPPSSGAVPPDDLAGEFGFDFRRFGVHVPAVLISPRIATGTVLRVPDNTTPLDHTSILKTVERRWNPPALTRRDAAAPDFGAVVTLTAPRNDDPRPVWFPSGKRSKPAEDRPSHLQEVHPSSSRSSAFRTGAAVPTMRCRRCRPAAITRHTRARTAAWKASSSR
jgi:phospholipase C